MNPLFVKVKVIREGSSHQGPARLKGIREMFGVALKEGQPNLAELVLANLDWPRPGEGAKLPL